MKKKKILSGADYEIITNTLKRTAIRDLHELLRYRVIVDISVSKTDTNKKYELK